MDRLFKTARDLRRRLHSSQAHSETMVISISGKKRNGDLVCCVRLSDGKIATKYVAAY